MPQNQYWSVTVDTSLKNIHRTDAMAYSKWAAPKPIKLKHPEKSWNILRHPDTLCNRLMKAENFVIPHDHAVSYACSLPYIPLGRLQGRANMGNCHDLPWNERKFGFFWQSNTTYQYLLWKLGTTRKSQTVPTDMLKLRPYVFAAIPLQKISILGLWAPNMVFCRKWWVCKKLALTRFESIAV